MLLESGDDVDNLGGVLVPVLDFLNLPDSKLLFPGRIFSKLTLESSFLRVLIDVDDDIPDIIDIVLGLVVVSRS